jgi:hypothetical protein
MADAPYVELRAAEDRADCTSCGTTDAACTKKVVGGGKACCSQCAYTDTHPKPEVENPVNDPVNSPSHYTAYKGLEIIDLTEQMNFNRGNAVKYIARAGLKNPTRDAEIEDLKKARWYIDREIARLEASE